MISIKDGALFAFNNGLYLLSCGLSSYNYKKEKIVKSVHDITLICNKLIII